jgi:hypothetical protein
MLIVGENDLMQVNVQLTKRQVFWLQEKVRESRIAALIDSTRKSKSFRAPSTVLRKILDDVIPADWRIR